jgi:site-specific DNA-methyltransferase (adenine-specific)
MDKEKDAMISYDTKNYKLLLGDCIKELKKLPEKSIDMIFADPPYRLSNDGITCHSGKMVSVNKGEWDKSNGVKEDYKFNKKWLKACDRVLKDNGTMWISGTYHIIHSIAFALLEMDYYIINEVSWVKPNAAPNMGCRCFTASQETLLWVKKSKKAKHIFNYDFMKGLNGGKQMRSVWEIPTTPKREKLFGKHPTQKPKELLYRIIMSSTNADDLILDPFCGSGTTGVVAIENNRRFIGVDNLPEYLELTNLRILDITKEEQICQESLLDLL